MRKADRKGAGKKIPGKINVEFTLEGVFPGFAIHDSWKIKDDDIQLMILAMIMTDPLYAYCFPENMYCRTIEDLHKEWKCHNLFHGSFTATTLDIVFKANLNNRAATCDFDRHGGACIIWSVVHRGICEYILGVD